MKRRGLKLYFLLLISCLLGCLLFYPRWVEPSLSSRLIPRNGVDVNGKGYALDKGSIVVLVFSPFNCSRCLEEIQIWNVLYGDFLDKLSVIAVIRAPSRSIVQRFVERNSIQFTVIYDSTESLSNIFLGRNLSPMRFFFKKGELVRTDLMGIQPNSDAHRDLVAWITKEITDAN